MKRIVSVDVKFNEGVRIKDSGLMVKGDKGTNFLELTFQDKFDYIGKQLIVNFVKPNNEIVYEIVNNVQEVNLVKFPDKALDTAGECLVELVLKNAVGTEVLTVNDLVKYTVKNTATGTTVDIVPGDGLIKTTSELILELSNMLGTAKTQFSEHSRKESEKETFIIAAEGHRQVAAVEAEKNKSLAAMQEYLIGEGAGKNTEFLGGRGASEYITRDEASDSGWFAGVRFTENGTDYDVERLGLAKGTSITRVKETDDLGNDVERIVSSFDNIFPWSHITPVILDNDANVVDRFGSETYDDTLSTNGYAPHTHIAMVQIPKCYWKHSVRDIPNKNGEWQEIEIRFSPYKLQGYTLPEDFIGVNADGTTYEKDYVYVRSYEGTLVNRNTGLSPFPNLPDDQSVRDRDGNDYRWGQHGATVLADWVLTSVNARNKQAPMSYTTIANFRTLAENRNSNKIFTQERNSQRQLINLLMWTEFADMNSQKIIGDGIVSLSWRSINDAATTGWTSCLGKDSGYVNAPLKRNGISYTRKSVRYRGMENLWGNLWKFLEGIKTGTAGKIKYGVYNPHVTNNYADYNANNFTLQKETEQAFNGSSEGYYRLFTGDFLPKTHKSGSNYFGGTATTRHGDYVWTNTTGGQICRVGADFCSGSYGGAAARTFSLTASYSYWFIGGGVSL